MSLSESHNDAVNRIRNEHWPACQEILRDAIEKMHVELEKTAESNWAYGLVNLLMLQEVFWRKAVVVAAGRDDADILGWVEQEYIDWDKQGEDESSHADGNPA
jgi:hypothetical protein